MRISDRQGCRPDARGTVTDGEFQDKVRSAIDAYPADDDPRDDIDLLSRNVRTSAGRVQERVERHRRFLAGHPDRQAFVDAVRYRSEASLVLRLDEEVAR